MGVSTDAYMFYGFTFAEELQAVDGGPEWTEEQEAKLIEELNDDCFYAHTKDNPDIGIDSHCSHDYPMHFIYYKPHFYRASRGSSSDIDVKALSELNTSDIDAKLKLFCDEHSIPWQQPTWQIVSYWG